jgi:hypothetical protein
MRNPPPAGSETVVLGFVLFMISSFLAVMVGAKYGQTRHPLSRKAL